MQTTVDLARVGSGNPKRPPKKKDRWKAPDEGVIKINTDVSFLEATMSGGTGLVVRDHRGSLIRGQAIWYGDGASALIMEARAILDGARLAMERNYNRVIIESDSQLAVNFCNRIDQDRSEIMSICQEIREIRRAFSSFSIVSVGRDANMAAHLCAKQASVDRRRCLWINYNPDFLTNTLTSDCTAISNQ
jgi:ribonuclease HI